MEQSSHKPKVAWSKGLTFSVLLVGYYNPILSCGEDKALQDARDDGANGCIMVDLPPEEASGFCEKYVKLDEHTCH